MSRHPVGDPVVSDPVVPSLACGVLYSLAVCAPDTILSLYRTHEGCVRGHFESASTATDMC